MAGIFGMGGSDGGWDSARNANAKNRGLYEGIELPDYQTYSPELYKTESSNYELAQDNPLLKSAQMSALAKMAGLADSGLSEVDQAGYEKARQLGGQVAKQGNAAALQNAQARGVGGSGLEFAMRESANQDAAQRTQDSALQQASDSARQRALYAQAYGQQLAGVRGQDAQLSQANTGIINRFNEMNTQNRNQTNAANVDQRNSAFKYNEGLKDKRYGNQMGRADRTAGLNNRDAEIAAGESAAENQRRKGTMGAIGAGIGAAYGGPAGASVGYGVGSSI